jgi:hypothetical protein
MIIFELSLYFKTKINLKELNEFTLELLIVTEIITRN